MFEVGEKVVCIGVFEGTNIPKLNEIVTINYFEFDEGVLFLGLEEYLFEDDGNDQVFISTKFRKLDTKFADNLLSWISKEVLEEELITV